MSPDVFERWESAIWGSLDAPDVEGELVGSMSDEDRSFLRRSGRHGARPRAARRLLSALADTDVRGDLSRVRCPTLIIHGDPDNFMPADGARLMAEAIPSSRLELLPTDDHIVVITKPDDVATLAETFLTGRTVERVVDRRLLAMLCTDIVESTRRAAALGDSRWRAVIAALDTASRDCVGRANGTVVKFTGDGHLAIFDQPGDAVVTCRELSDLAQALDVPIRIGIHFGEVEILDGDVLGVAVVMATRAMSVGGQSETIATSTLVDLVEGAEHTWVSIGSRELKGFDRPRELWRLSHDG